MSAIKRFFSSHKTSSNSKVNPHLQQENQTAQTKASVIEKGPTTDHDESKENTSPSIELPSKYGIQIE